ncbi:MAG TPA: formyltransferase family protein [Cytophagales bacterium]|nr:formyltransferase family protein [Cytophagales bacterium]
MKIILLCNSVISSFEKEVITKVKEHKSVENIYGIIYERKHKGIIEKVITNFKKGRGGYILIMALKRVFSKVDEEASEKILIESNIEYQVTKRLYSSSLIELISNLYPDLIILIGGFGIIKKEILLLPKIGVVSFHHGDMSKYRGMPPGFWELYNNENEVGITVQILNEELDSGIPIVFKKVDILPEDTYNQLLNRMYSESPDMITEALSILERKNKEDFTPINGLGRIYTLPNLTQWILFQIKITKRKLFNVKASTK